MKTFDSFYYSLLSESPMSIGDSREDYSLETIMAMDEYSKIMDNPDTFHKVFSANNEISVDLYEEEENNNEIICWFVPTNNNFVVGYVAYNKLSDGGVETTSVFNDKRTQFLAYKVYLNYLLTRYKYIMSDKRHTGSGKKFWENLVLFSLGKGNKVSVVDDNTSKEVEEITNYKEIEKYYGDLSDERFRIKIENI